MKLSLRELALGVYLTFFALFSIWLFFIPSDIWSNDIYGYYRVILETEIALFFVSGLGSTLLAYRVYKDGKDIQALKESQKYNYERQ